MRDIAIRLTELYYRQLINKQKLTVLLRLPFDDTFRVDDCVVVRCVIGRVSCATNKATHHLCFASVDHIQKCLPHDPNDQWFRLVLRLTHLVESV